MHNATVLAFREAANPQFAPGDLPPFQPEKLYFHTIPHGVIRFAVRMMRLFWQDPTRVGKNKDINLASIVEVDFPTHARISFGPVAQIRDEAAACHASQGAGSLLNKPLTLLRRVFASYETFMRAYPEPARGAKLERDLFDGVNG
jgi:hypothetical protein